MVAFGMPGSMQPLITHVLPGDRIAIDLGVLAFSREPAAGAKCRPDRSGGHRRDE